MIQPDRKHKMNQSRFPQQIDNTAEVGWFVLKAWRGKLTAWQQRRNYSIVWTDKAEKYEPLFRSLRNNNCGAFRLWANGQSNS